jgi:hypothetical protein
VTANRLLPALLVCASLAAPARAADLDRCLPADSQIVVNVNLRQLLDSELVKKHALETLRDALKGADMVEDILKDLGLDPFKDLDRIIAAGPGGKDSDRGLVIVHGRFDGAKFKAKAEEAIKTYGEVLKTVKVPDGKGGSFLMWEVSAPEVPMPVFVALSGSDTLLVSPGKDYVVDALRRVARKEAASLKDKDFQALLDKLDDRQNLSFAATSAALSGAALPGAPAGAADALTKFTALGGGLTLTDELKVEVVVAAKTVEEAREFRDTADSSLKLVLALLATAAQGKDANPGLELALDIVKSLEVKVKDKTIVVKGRLSGEAISEVMKKLK